MIALNQRLNVNGSRTRRDATSTTIKHDAERSRNNLKAHATDVSQSGTLDPANEQALNLSSMRKASLNLQTQQKAMALYKAPVVKEKYR